MAPSQVQYSTALCSKLQGWWRRQASTWRSTLRTRSCGPSRLLAPRFLIVLAGQPKA